MAGWIQLSDDQLREAHGLYCEALRRVRSGELDHAWAALALAEARTKKTEFTEAAERMLGRILDELARRGVGLDCTGAGASIPMADPSCEAMQGKTQTEGYCWRCDAYAPVGPVFRDPDGAGWVAILKPHVGAPVRRP